MQLSRWHCYGGSIILLVIISLLIAATPLQSQPTTDHLPGRIVFPLRSDEPLPRSSLYVPEDIGIFDPVTKELTLLEVGRLNNPPISIQASATRFILYQSDSMPIYVIDVAGNENYLLEPVTSDDHMRWSPDGQMIAFVRREDFSLHVTTYDGTQATLLSEKPTIPSFITWSPDSQRIAFVAGETEDFENNEIYVVSLDDLAVRQLTYNSLLEWFPEWSPDGQWIAFTSSAGLHIVDVDTGEMSRILAGEHLSPPQWMDSGRLMFSIVDSGVRTVQTVDIYTGEIKDIIRRESMWGGFLSSDQRYLLYNIANDVKEQGDICIFNIETQVELCFVLNMYRYGIARWIPE